MLRVNKRIHWLRKKESSQQKPQKQQHSSLFYISKITFSFLFSFFQHFNCLVSLAWLLFCFDMDVFLTYTSLRKNIYIKSKQVLTMWPFLVAEVDPPEGIAHMYRPNNIIYILFSPIHIHPFSCHSFRRQTMWSTHITITKQLRSNYFSRLYMFFFLLYFSGLHRTNRRPPPFTTTSVALHGVSRVTVYVTTTKKPDYLHTNVIQFIYSYSHTVTHIMNHDNNYYSVITTDYI